MKKLTSAVLAASLVTGLVSTAFAAPSADEVNTAYARLNHYGIVQGIANKDGVVEPALEQPITRAQLLTILTRAWGQEDNAKLLKGATTGFSDVDGVAGVEWATGYVFIGSRVAETNGGQKLGTSATTFNPNADLTAIQTLAFVMKFLGLSVPGGDTWVADTIKSAKEAGLITDADEAKYLANPNAAVNRGQAFAMLDNLFASYNKLAGGKTVYTKYIDASAPELTVAEPTLTTDKAEIKVTGSVKGDFTGVFLGSEKITVNADGTFEAVVKLNVGANPFTISAIDMVGNTDEVSYTVTRNPGAAAKITASMAGTVVAGEATDLTISVTDANGVALEVAAADITVTVGGSVGTYDATTGKFTAAEKAGAGTVTVSYGELTPATVDVKVVAGVLAKLNADKASVAKGDVITLTATDKHGNAIASGVTYTWTGSGIAVTPDGKVYTSVSGKYSVTAKAGDATATAEIGVFGAIDALKVSAPESIVANGMTIKEITVQAIDEFGNAISNYEGTIALEGTGVTFHKKADKSDPGASRTTKTGVATFYVVFDSNVAGEDIAIKASTTKGDVTYTGETVVTAVAPVPTGLKVTASPTYLAANSGSEGTVEVKVVDQEGVALRTGGAYEIAATVTGPAKLDAGNTTANYNSNTGAAAEFDFTNTGFIGQEGTITFTFTAEGIGTTTATVKHVIAGHAEKLNITAEKASVTADDLFKVTVETTDRNGVPVVVYKDTTLALTATWSKDAKGNTVPFALYEDADGTLNAAKEIAANSTKAVFYVKPMGKFTGDFTLTFEAKYLDSVSKTITMKNSINLNLTPGKAAKVAVDRSFIEVPVSTHKANYVFSVADKLNNTVPSADVEILLYGEVHVTGTTYEDPAGHLTANGSVLKNETANKPVKVKTNAEGKVTVEVDARPYTGKTYRLTGVLAGTEAAALMSVVDAVPASVTIEVWKEVYNNTAKAWEYTKVGNAKAGDTVILRVTAKDNYGSPITGIGSTLKLVADKVLGDGTELIDSTGISFVESSTYTTDGDIANKANFAKALKPADGVYYQMVEVGKAGLQSLGVKYDKTQTEVKATASLRVYAGDANKLVANGGEKLKLKKGEISNGVTLQLTDKYGNPVSIGTKQNVTWTISSSADANAYPYFSIRSSATGTTINDLNISSAFTIYVVATKGGTSAAPITYTVTFDGGAYDGTLVVEVTE